MEKDYLGSNIKKLGFGLMRLPMRDGNIDMEHTKQMVDLFMSKGFSYFDTAYVYIGGKSEVAAKEALVDRYPRDSFQLATKMPMFSVHTAEDLPRFFEESMARAGVEYFDFYLLHALNKGAAVKCEELGAWDYVKGLKEQGRIKHIGFSYHDNAEVLDDILTKHPETEFVQLQINYADWDDEGVQARKCHEVAMKHNVPVVIMEPVKGGSLVSMHESVGQVLKNANPDASLASWAIRFAASLDGLVTVLSGMSNMEQMEDNVSFMDDFKPLTDAEREVIDAAVAKFNEVPKIPCTDCKYCVEDCPQKINIPAIFEIFNEYKIYANRNSINWSYNNVTRERGKPSECIACGACEGHCPQKIGIIDNLKEFAGIIG